MNTIPYQYPINLHTPCILVVEDDLDDQIFLKIAFEKTTKNLCLHFVSSTKEALDYLQQAPDHMLPDLIVSDYKLPKHNGLRLIQQLNAIERYAAIEKVILSNSCYLPGSGLNKVQPYTCFVKPHSFAGMQQLAVQLLQLCAKTINVSGPGSMNATTCAIY
jgi:CheY-like chemotaxis protein